MIMLGSPKEQSGKVEASLRSRFVEPLLEKMLALRKQADDYSNKGQHDLAEDCIVKRAKLLGVLDAASEEEKLDYLIYAQRKLTSLKMLGFNKLFTESYEQGIRLVSSLF